MATIPPFFADCVVAIGALQGAQIVTTASGFLYGQLVVNDPDPASRKYRLFLVTNRHVVDKVQQIFLRFNPKAQQPAVWFPLALVDQATSTLRWAGAGDVNADVAVVLINADALTAAGIQYHFFASDQHAADRDKMVAMGTTEGDFVFVLGFPMGLVGGNRNYVIMRHGSIARLRDAVADRSISEFMIDSIVLPGNSGGPVVTRPEAMAIVGTPSVASAHLIGIAKGYVPYQEIAVSQQTQRPRVVFEDNSGLTLVVPVDYIDDAIRLLVEREEHKQTTNPIPAVVEQPSDASAQLPQGNPGGKP